MNEPTPASGDSDESFLDEAFDGFVAARSEGVSVDWSSMVEGREHLESELRELWSLACKMTESRVRTRSVGGFELIREVGRGSMGVVHLVAQQSLGGRHVALKILNSAGIVGSQERKRFLAEAHSLAKVKHRNIVEIYEVIETPEHTAFAMEWVEGGSLGDYLDDRKSDAKSDADFVPFLCRVGARVGHALEAMHAEGLTHRDVKPSNILLRADGTPLLSDFGLVRNEAIELQTQSGAFLGTLAFAAPEQLRGEALDARADVYSLACTLYYCLTSKVPHAGSTPDQLLHSIDEARARPLRRLVPELPRDLETVVTKGMEADPGDRYDSAAAFAADLERILALRPIRGRRQGLRARTWKWVRRQRRGLAAAAVGAAVAAVLVGWWLSAEQRERVRAARVAERIRDARLSLLDTKLERRVRIGLRFGDPALMEVVLVRSTAALALYDEALEIDPNAADHRLERDAVANAVAVLRGDEGRRWTASSAGTGAADLRALGLHAYVVGDIQLAIDAWRQCESKGATGPLISAFLGHAQLVLGRPELAYPRLSHAARAFPDAGFLQAVAGRAALFCGDTHVAHRMAQRAISAGLPSENELLLALQADLEWARGGTSAALRAYEREALEDSYLRSAEHAVERGAYEVAIYKYCSLVSNFPDDLHYRRELIRNTGRWWNGLDAAARREVLVEGLEGKRRELGYFFGVLAQVAMSIERIGERANGATSVPAFSVRANEALFDRDLGDRRWARDSIEALSVRLDVQSLDLERLTQLADSHASLASLWLADDADSRQRADAALSKRGARLATGERPFGPVRRDLPDTLRVVAEVEGIEVPFGHMWTEFHIAADDLDGDGHSDFLVGCSATSDQPAQAGRVCAVSGADGSVLWQHVGKQYDNVGAKLANARDVDGDGVLDVLVNRTSISGGRSGVVTLISGADGSALSSFRRQALRCDTHPSFVGLSEREGHEAAFVVGSAKTGDERAGAVRAFAIDGREIWSTLGAAPGAGLGHAIVNAGDLDGDGVDDVVANCFASRELVALSGATGGAIRRFAVWSTGAPKLPLVAHSRDARRAWLPIVSDEKVFARLILSNGTTRDSVRPRVVNEGFGTFTQVLGDLDGDGLSDYAVTSLSGRSPHRPRVRIYSSRGGCIAELEGFIWIRRLGLDPLLPAPRGKRLVAIGLDRWSRYADGPVGGPTRIVLLDYVTD